MGNWSWQDDAACRREDASLFFAPEGERGLDKVWREDDARGVCRYCPVRTECLDYALSRPEKFGMWGGLNEDERASERRRRMRRGRETAADVKACKDCQTLKPAAAFYREKRSLDRLSVFCRVCTRRRRDNSQAVAS